ncbi:glycosyltransferase [Novosphingobium ginsenosidimutans]|uniref:Glycosyltransferase n=1 Tax=Novosphingobium ginsenosidimutans TaxID=1176536 RepID=A0A5B8S423_9SPHN|nr:glycosyltransferase [Novosphingobium ginsenosidimutans]QEA15822.1 glycosyltransferase [Novosphingobium ginsenosidimutans]
MTEPASSLHLHFPGFALLPPQTKPATVRPRIGWFLLKVDVSSASARYRCFHFARVLADDFESVYFTRYQDLKAEIDTLDAIIVVKRLDRSVIDLAALAQHTGKPIFLDLCDDLIHPSYPNRDEPGFAITALRAVLPVLAGITVPSAEMAARIEAYLGPAGRATCSCHVIPDIAETSDLFTATARFVTGRSPRGMPPVGNGPRFLDVQVAPVESREKRIVWFGNYGAHHSDFGMFSLKSRLRPLREFHQEVPLELVVISNSRPVFDALVDKCGFPTRYVPWSGSAVYEELLNADAALLTTGTDDFCTVKSSNRVVQALACGVPVIADKSTALAEFEDLILSGNMRRCLELCLKPENERLIAARLDQTRRILDRYSPEILSRSWSVLLTRAIGQHLVKAATVRRTGLLLILGQGDELDDALTAIKAMNNTPGLDYHLLVSTELLESDPRFARAIHAARVLPRFFSGKLRGMEGPIAQYSAVIIGERNSSHGKIVVDLSVESGLELLDFKDVRHLDLTVFCTADSPAVTSVERPTPGPYPQRLNADGSVDWAFIIHSNARGWILDAICQEIGSRQPGSWTVVGHRSPPPPARNLFFSHFSLLDSFDRRYPEQLSASKVFLWYTHPREETQASIARSLDLFSRTTRVIFTCEANRTVWLSRGLAPERTAVVLGAADPQLFKGHQRGDGCVGLSSSFYERKNPDLMLDVIKALPHRQFTLLGRNWNRYARFEELRALPNFTYRTAAYRDYPGIYGTFDVFLSISSLEGGPIPLIEAMMSNAVPVASNTGFAPDLITPGENGFIFDNGVEPAYVASLVERAFTLATDVRSTVAMYDWDSFSARIVELAQ